MPAGSVENLVTSETAFDEPLVPDEDRGLILDWISPINDFAKHLDLLCARQAGTGDWLLRTTTFDSWLDGSGKALWLSGIPGAGKTVLASMIIEHLSNIQQPTRIGLAWVYFDYKEESTQTPHAIFLSITRQLADSSPELYNHFRSVDHQNPHSRPSPDDLLSDDILMRGFEQAFVVVDALDECAEANRDIFLEMMARLQASGANILITSREHVYDHITTSALNDVERVDIRADPEDLAKYVAGCMQKQTRLANIVSPSLRQDIVTTITDSCEGMFLMARLQIESLRKHTTAASESIRTALQILPTTIHGIYDEAIHRIETNDRSEDALSVVSCLIHARRPLKVEEVQHFLAIRPGVEDHITDRDALISMCAGLVIVDDKDIIRLVHFTAQEYFEQRHQALFPRGDEEMGRKCLAYLSLDALRDSKSFGTNNAHFSLDYIVENWHFRVLPHQNALRELLLGNPNFDVEDSNGKTPLMCASERGYESAVKFLLDHGSDVNGPGGRSTALILASKTVMPRSSNFFLDTALMLKRKMKMG
ncbi:hypothetical protein C8R43DRAFT_1070316 [Mycena crocata]|nr:hypothetical protein C8R43DRAFT_1070316 [Mycena crocata]